MQDAARTLAHALAGALVVVLATPAGATTGFGCYRANVGPDDPLNVRAEASAASPVVGTVSHASASIIALRGLTRGENTDITLYDVHRAETSLCRPASLPLGARWCPVALYGGGGTQEGWIKRRFLDHSECP